MPNPDLTKVLGNGQFAVGFSARSTTTMSIGSFAGTSLSPSCSWIKVNSEGPLGSSIAAAADFKVMS